MKEETHQKANGIEALLGSFVHSSDALVKWIGSREPLTAHRRDQMVAMVLAHGGLCFRIQMSCADLAALIANEDVEPDRQIPDEDGGL